VAINRQEGFILPALIVFSLVLMSMGLVTLQYVASSTNSVQSAFYTSMAKEAANAGAAFAYSCLRSSDGTPEWAGVKKVLTPSSNCAGVNASGGADCSATDTAADTSTLSSASNGSWKSRFSVCEPTMGAGGISFTAKGAVEFFYAGSATPTQTFTATTKVNIPYDLTASTLRRAVGKAVTHIDTGGNYSCAIANSQTYCWGFNGVGQLGFGDNVNRSLPTLMNTGDLTNKRVSTIATGYVQTCATSDGRAYCWGINQRGQLGNGTSPGFLADWGVVALLAATRHTPTKVTGPLNTTNVTKVSPSWSTDDSRDRTHVCALSDGRVFCWGSNFWGQLSQPKYDGLINALCVANGWVSDRIFGIPSAYLCAQPKNTGTTIGSNHDETSPVPLFGFSNRSVEDDAALLYENRGNGTYGKRATDLDTGMYGSCLIAEGLTYCWGESQMDIRGSADPTGGLNTKSVNAVKEGSLSGRFSTSVAASGTSGCSVANGRLHCWGRMRGDGFNSLIGNDTPKEVALPNATWPSGLYQIPVTNPYVEKVKSSTEQSGPICGMGNGSIFCWGVGQPNTLSPIMVSLVNNSEAVTDFGTGGGQSFVGGLIGLQGVSCAVANATAYCSGNNTYGQLGLGTTGSSTTTMSRTYNNGPANPNTIGLTEGVAATEISAGENHNCAVINGGAYCWGLNTNGQLGVGDSLNRLHPSGVRNLSGIKSVTKVAAGTSHSCAVSNSQTYCWGNQQYNKLGNGITTDTNQLTPVQVTANGLGSMAISDVSVGVNHTCVVANSKVYCWGLNTNGQLGQGNTSTHTTPVEVAGLLSGKAVTKVAVGNNFTCAIANGRPYCWGSDASGQLGNGSGGSSNVPVLVNNLPGASTDIQAGADFACAVEAGIVKCWGSRANGRLGDGGSTSGTQQTPVTVSGMATGGADGGPRNATSLSLGSSHACAIINGLSYCWGNRIGGRLGDNTSSSQSTTPSAVLETNAAGAYGPQNTPYRISAGGNGSCAVANARIYCWGAGESGQIGNDLTPANVLTPTNTVDYTRDTTIVSWSDSVFY
jgi:alpha-tubulin suppressor-like RCC1 family protein